MTHAESVPCPFEIDRNPIGVSGTCCSFRGNMAALYLLAMGLAPLVFRLYEDKLPEESLEFAGELRQAVAMLRKDILDDERSTRATRGVPANAELESVTVRIPDVGWEFPLDKAIEAAARWHVKVARMLCGIHASY